MATTRISSFIKGMSDDTRTEEMSRMRGGVVYHSEEMAVLQHMDLYSNPSRITPNPTTLLDDNGGSDTTLRAHGIQNFCEAAVFGSSVLFGFGNDGASHPKVYRKTGAYYQDTSTWGTTGNSAASANTLPTGFTSGYSPYNLFFHYKGFIYGLGTSGGVSKYLWKYDVTAAAAFVDSFATLGATPTTTANGIIHKGDDIAYFAYNNVVCSINGAGTFTDNVLVLPTNLRILSLAPYGNYLAVSAAPISGVGASQVLLWDRDSSLAGVTTIIDWGEGNLKVLDNVYGNLIGVSEILTDNGFGANTASVLVKIYGGSEPIIFKEIKLNASASSSVPALTQSKQVKDNKLFFHGTLPTDRGTIAGIWCVGKKTGAMPWALSVPIIEKNLAAGKTINGFIAVGNFWWIAYDTDGSVSKTRDPASGLAGQYTTTSVYDSQVFSERSPSAWKKLIGVTLEFTPLPSNGSLTLQYRKDSDSSYTTIFTYTGAGTHSEFGASGISNTNSLYHKATNIESTGANLPTYREIQFRIQSTGGAEVLGFNFETEEITANNY